MHNCTAGAGGLHLGASGGGRGVSQDHPEVLSRRGKLMSLPSKMCPPIFGFVTKSPVFISLSGLFILPAIEPGLQVCLSLIIISPICAKFVPNTPQTRMQIYLTRGHYRQKLSRGSHKFISFPVCTGRVLLQPPLQLGWEHVTESWMMKYK